MSGSRVDQLLEAAQWLRLSGDMAGAKKLYEQVLSLDPENATAADYLSGRDTSALPKSESPASTTNPFQRVDPKKSNVKDPLDQQWGSWGAPPSSAPASTPTQVGFELSWGDEVSREPAPHTPFGGADPFADLPLAMTPTPLNAWGEGTGEIESPVPSDRRK